MLGAGPCIGKGQGCNPVNWGSMGSDWKTNLDAVTAAFDAALAQPEAARIEAVTKVMAQVCAHKLSIFKDGQLDPSESGYARRLIHLDPAGRYSIVVAVWAPGQSTPLHDHNGLWCVEGVYQGRIRVTSFDVIDESGGVMQFKAEDSALVTTGEVGALIPPNEYHLTENAEKHGVTVTLHIYGGELTSCHAYYPKNGSYHREPLELPYTG